MRWRVGNISRVSKSGSANSCPSDYRPITPVLSKVFERLLAKRLNNFAEKKNFFHIYSLVFVKVLVLVIPSEHYQFCPEGIGLW